MQLLLAVDIYPPSHNAGGLLMQDLAQSLVRDGHQVILVTPDPSIEKSHIIEVDENRVTVLRVRTRVIKGQSLSRRAINEMLLSWALWREYKRSTLSSNPIQAIVWYSPSIFLGPFVNFVKRRFESRAYLILRDIFPDWAVDAGVLRKGIAYRIFKCFEQYQYAVADVIGVQSPGNLEYFAKLSYRARLDVLFNWINLDKEPTTRSGLLEALGLAGKKGFIFRGNKGVAQDMDNS